MSLQIHLGGMDFVSRLCQLFFLPKWSGRGLEIITGAVHLADEITRQSTISQEIKIPLPWTTDVTLTINHNFPHSEHTLVVSRSQHNTLHHNWFQQIFTVIWCLTTPKICKMVSVHVFLLGSLLAHFIKWFGPLLKIPLFYSACSISPKE